MCLISAKNDNKKISCKCTFKLIQTWKKGERQKKCIKFNSMKALWETIECRPALRGVYTFFVLFKMKFTFL